jgi:adenylate kinase family enzyme
MTETRHNRIHIFGASGAGTTTLGTALAQKLKISLLDTDDFFWIKTEIPYTVKREVGQRVELLKNELEKHPSWVLSGSLCGWGDCFIPMFTLAVFLMIPHELRMARLKEREIKRYGPAALSPGGWFYQNHLEFMEYAAQYDTAGLEIRSRVLHEEWMSTLPCKIIRIEEPLDTGEMVEKVVKYIDM